MEYTIKYNKTYVEVNDETVKQLKELLIEVYTIYPYNLEDYNDIWLKQYLERQIKVIDSKCVTINILSNYYQSLMTSLKQHYNYMCKYKNVDCMKMLITHCVHYNDVLRKYAKDNISLH